MERETGRKKAGLEWEVEREIGRKKAGLEQKAKREIGRKEAGPERKAKKEIGGNQAEPGTKGETEPEVKKDSRISLRSSLSTISWRFFACFLMCFCFCFFLLSCLAISFGSSKSTFLIRLFLLLVV